MDLTLAEALGFARPRKIRELIKSNEEGLKRFGSLPCEGQSAGTKGGRPAKVYYLTEKQAIYLTAKSDTPTAADITVQIVEVFTAWRNGTLEELNIKPQDVQVFGMMFQS